MKFSLIFKTEKDYFEVEYRNIIMSFIKKAVESTGNYDRFYSDSAKKDYCFTVIFNNSKFYKNKIFLDKNEIKVIFSVDDRSVNKFILLNSLINQIDKKFDLKDGNSMTLNKINMLKTDEVTSNKAIFRTSAGSSLCVREHNRETNRSKYYTLEDKEFKSKLLYVVKRQLKKAEFSQPEIDSLDINIIRSKKVVIKFYNQLIDSNVCIFEIKCSNRVLKYLHQSGMGSRTSCGFGMIELVTNDI